MPSSTTKSLPKPCIWVNFRRTAGSSARCRRRCCRKWDVAAARERQTNAVLNDRLAVESVLQRRHATAGRQRYDLQDCVDVGARLELDHSAAAGGYRLDPCRCSARQWNVVDAQAESKRLKEEVRCVRILAGQRQGF